MVKVLIHLIILLHRILFIQSQIDFEWEQTIRLRLKDEKFKCGIENKYKHMSKARMINGAETTNIRYPWMAQIYIFIPKTKGTLEFASICGGSIISEKSILTNIHCVCINHVRNPTFYDEHPITCLVDSDEPQNQNRPENQIHYTIGSMPDLELKDIGNENGIFNKDLRVYLYKYDPNWYFEKGDRARKHFYKNGDAAIIIDDSKLGLNLKLYQAIPICLPSLEFFAKKKKIDVIHVGRGLNYEEIRSGWPIKSSCVTNGERIHNSIPGNSDFKFRECKNYNREHPEKSCYNVRDAVVKNRKDSYRKDLISTGFKIKFPKESGQGNNQMEIDIPKNDKCEELSDKIMNALDRLNNEEKIKYLKDDQKGPSRIIIFEKKEKASKFTNEIHFQRQYIRWEKNPTRSYANCYNLKRVEQYGTCETEGTKIYSTIFGHSVKINYGFCGSSCKTPNLQEF